MAAGMVRCECLVHLHGSHHGGLNTSSRVLHAIPASSAAPRIFFVSWRQLLKPGGRHLL